MNLSGMESNAGNTTPRRTGPSRPPAAIRPDGICRPARPTVILLMGVSGSGKSTVGVALAQELGWGFRDADTFHPPENVAKMSSGKPLDDRDREPWLAAIRKHVDETIAAGKCAIVTCSALKARYRRVIQEGRPEVKLVHLVGDFDLLYSRMSARHDHFMKPEMLRSQFAALEPPADALVIDVRQSVASSIAQIRLQLGL